MLAVDARPEKRRLVKRTSFDAELSCLGYGALGLVDCVALALMTIRSLSETER